MASLSELQKQYVAKTRENGVKAKQIFLECVEEIKEGKHDEAIRKHVLANGMNDRFIVKRLNEEFSNSDCSWDTADRSWKRNVIIDSEKTVAKGSSVWVSTSGATVMEFHALKEKVL
jgi:hypothetical protein